MVGEVVSHFRIEAELGTGGMGTVYKATDLRLGRPVALKFVAGARLAQAEAKQRLEREARAASALDHPNLCPVYEIDETADGRLFVAMAYYDGDTLGARLAQGPLPVSEALRIATEMARGLAAAHAAGVVHRDIKPSNVMLTRGGRVKILDFGLAKTADEPGNLTRTGAALGTVAYMSPEQARGGAIDARTDLWSLGVVLYEMLTGRRPFASESEFGLLQAIVSSEPPPLRSLAPGLPHELAEVLERLLAKSPEKRFISATEAVAVLERLRQPSRGEVTTAFSPRRPKLRPRRWPAPVVAALALLMLGGAGWVALKRWTSPRSAPARSVQGPEFRSAEVATLFARAMELLAAVENPQGPDLAAELLRRGLEREAGHPDLLAALARADLARYDRSRDATLLASAEQRARAALAAAPQSLEGKLALAGALRLRGNTDEALSLLRELVALEPGSDRAHRELARAYRAAGDPAMAETNLREAIRLQPNLWENWNELGSLLFGQGSLGEARKCFVRAAELAPAGVTWPLENVASVAMVEGDYRAAVGALERLPQPLADAMAASNLGTAYYYLGEMRRAEESFRLAVRLAPRNDTYHRNLGDTLAREGDRAGALASWGYSLDLVTDLAKARIGDADLALKGALLLAKLGRCEESERSLAGVSEPALGARQRYLAAQGRALCRDRERALALLRAALAAGYPSAGIADEAEFEALRADSEFLALVGKSVARGP